MIFEDVSDAMLLLQAFEFAYSGIGISDPNWHVSLERLQAQRAFTQFPDLRKSYPKTSEKCL